MPPRKRRKSQATTSPAILERNLERYPWARLSDDKGDQLRLEVLFEAAGEEGRAWTVVAENGSKLPGPFAADLYVVLCQLYNGMHRPESRTVKVTFRELAELLHRQVGGNIYEAIHTSLHQLAGVSIRAVQTFREGDKVAALKTFHLIESTETAAMRGDGPANLVAKVRFSEEIAESIAAGNFRLLDTAEYFAVQSPTARRLYRYLDYRRWQGAQRLTSVSFPLRQIAEELPIDRSSPSHIKRTLDPAHAHLVERGFLESAEYEEQALAGKKRPLIWVVYRFRELELPTAEAPAGRSAPAPADDAEYLRERVGDILQLLRDERSAGFYAKAVKVLPESVLEGIIGHVRQSLQEGVTVDVARKVFTTTARSRAKAIGLEL
jgi:hypothetical protein